jgi:hypothetical protein
VGEAASYVPPSSLFYKGRNALSCVIIQEVILTEIYGFISVKRENDMIDQLEQFELTEKQEKILSALMSNFTVQEAAQSLGVTNATIYTALKDENLRKAYKWARRYSVQQAINTLSKGMELAARRLIKIVRDDKQTATAHISASNAILLHGWKAVEVQDISERLAALEQNNSNGKLQPAYLEDEEA